MSTEGSSLIQLAVQEGAVLTEVPEQGFFAWFKEQIDGMETGACRECGTPGVRISVVVPVKVISFQCSKETCSYYSSGLK